jgi:hypothetical protein
VIERETPQVESTDETIESDDASEADALLDELAEETEQVVLSPE